MTTIFVLMYIIIGLGSGFAAQTAKKDTLTSVIAGVSWPFGLGVAIYRTATE